MKNILLLFLSTYLSSQTPVSGPVSPRISAVQIIVSPKHPDSMDNLSTVIYDNIKGIDKRSFYRPLKTNDSLIKDILISPEEVVSNDHKIDKIEFDSSLPLYIGSKRQNIFIINELNIKPGWSKNDKWNDGTIVDDNSIVDWIRYGMGVNRGILTTADKTDRGKLFKKLYLKSLSNSGIVKNIQ